MSEVKSCASGIRFEDVAAALLGKVSNGQNNYDGCVGVRVVEYAYDSCIPLLCDGWENFQQNLVRACAPGPDLKPVLRIVYDTGETGPTYDDLVDFTGCVEPIELDQLWKFPFVLTSTNEVALFLIDCAAR